LGQVVQKVHKKFLQGRERWVLYGYVLQLVGRIRGLGDEDKGLLARPTESGRRDEEEEKDDERYWRSMTPTE
jgi:hypothetical protein